MDGDRLVLAGEPRDAKSVGRERGGICAGGHHLLVELCGSGKIAESELGVAGEAGEDA